MADQNGRRLSRRTWMQAAVAAGAAAGTGLTLTKAHAAPTISLEPGDVILFQGDSITDAGRDRKRQEVNYSPALGNGYAMMAITQLLGAHPALALQCHNRGISGNKVPDLDARWEEDAVALKPRVISILIGVNDIWHKLNGKYDGTVESYEEQYTALLKRTREALPGTTIVVCEPFVLRCGAVNDGWFPEFDERRAAAKRVAEAAGAIWVPFQRMFDDHLTEATPADYWARDGVHPSVPGHALMARSWMSTTGLG